MSAVQEFKSAKYLSFGRVDLRGRAWQGAGLAVILALMVALSGHWTWLVEFPAEWQLPFAPLVDTVTNTVVPVLLPACRLVSAILGGVLGACIFVLHHLPWPVVLIASAAIAWVAGGAGLLTFAITANLYVVATGFWEQAMTTLSLVILAVPVSIGLGFALGLGAFLLPRIRRPVVALLDIMQTFPAFGYLIPLLMLFGFGPVAGLVSTIVYALPPMARCTILGLSTVPDVLVEVGLMTGATGRQRLMHVLLPNARPLLLMGVNQTIMAALSMVIMASIIGGFDDIGWAVLDGLRAADFGRSLLSGLVIVVLSIMIDRATLGLSGGRARERLPAGIRMRHLWFFVGGVLALGGLCACAMPQAVKTLDGLRGVISPDMLNTTLMSFVTQYGWIFCGIKAAVFYFALIPLRIGLVGAIQPFTWGFAFTPDLRVAYFVLVTGATALCFASRRVTAGCAIFASALALYVGMSGFPWPAALLVVTLLGWIRGGLRLALLAGGTIAFILVCGLWVPFTHTSYLIIVAVAACILLGGGIGFLAGQSRLVSRIVRPLNDALQTMPQFVFLIPALMLFNVGEFAGLIAITLYAIAPPIRYAELGLREVPPSLLEVGRQIGCSPAQLHLFVKVPAAKPTFLLGINQTVMAALSMLPVAATVGTMDLGQQVYIAISKADPGLGITSGLAISLIAMTLDRIFAPNRT